MQCNAMYPHIELVYVRVVRREKKGGRKEGEKGKKERKKGRKKGRKERKKERKERKKGRKERKEARRKKRKERKKGPISAKLSSSPHPPPSLSLSSLAQGRYLPTYLPTYMDKEGIKPCTRRNTYVVPSLEEEEDKEAETEAARRDI